MAAHLPTDAPAKRRKRAPAATIPDRREQLLEAGRQAFVEKGFDNTKIADIVGRAGLAQGTFYLYFESKHAIMLALSAEVTTSFYASGMDTLAKSKDFSSGIDEAVAAVLQLARKQRDFIAVMHHGRVVNDVQAQNGSVRLAFHAQIVGFVQRAMEENRLPKSADPGIVADLCVAVVDAGVQSIAHDDAARIGPLTIEIGAFLKRALGLPASEIRLAT